MPYYLQKDVYLNVSDRYCVFLNLSADQYICVARQQFGALSPWMVNSSERRAADLRSSNSTMPRDVQEFANAMAAKQLLTTDPELGKPVGCEHIERATSSLFECNTEQVNWFDAKLLTRFFVAGHLTNRKLHHQAIAQTVREVANRKRGGVHGSSVDPSRVAELANSFNTLRKYFPRKYLCLFDSLALVEFLARYGVYPQWVFGTRAEPFEAHCWVQHETILLNDTIEYTSQFSPIMII